MEVCVNKRYSIQDDVRHIRCYRPMPDGGREEGEYAAWRATEEHCHEICAALVRGRNTHGNRDSHVVPRVIVPETRVSLPVDGGWSRSFPFAPFRGDAPPYRRRDSLLDARGPCQGDGAEEVWPTGLRA